MFTNLQLSQAGFTLSILNLHPWSMMVNKAFYSPFEHLLCHLIILTGFGRFMGSCVTLMHKTKWSFIFSFFFLTSYKFNKKQDTAEEVSMFSEFSSELLMKSTAN